MLIGGKIKIAKLVTNLSSSQSILRLKIPADTGLLLMDDMHELGNLLLRILPL